MVNLNPPPPARCPNRQRNKKNDPAFHRFSLDKEYPIFQISNMPRAKTEPFPETIVALADFAKALAHPARIQILTFLQVHGPSPCMDIVAQIPLSQPSVSRHIAALSEAGLLEENPKGNTIHYSLCKDRIQMFCETFSMTLKPASPAKSSASPQNSNAHCSLK